MPLPAPVTSATRVTRRRSDAAAELVLDVDADDLVEVRLRPEAELDARAARRSCRGQPATIRMIVSSGSRRMQPHRVVAGDVAQRGDLPGNGLRDARHRQAAAVAERRRSSIAAAWRRKPTAARGEANQ